MSKIGKIDFLSSDEFKKIVENNNTIKGVLFSLGFKNSSGAMHNKVKERVQRENIDTTHMIGRFSSKNGKRISLADILIENSDYQNIGRLKKRLVSEKVLEYKCVKCNNNGEWMGSSLMLQLDHINGNKFDHRLVNLRFLCPNCHSQTETFGGKNTNKRVS